MGTRKSLVTLAMLLAATGAWAAEAAKEPPPTWPWPGPTPPEIRDALVMKRGMFRPTEQDLSSTSASILGDFRAARSPTLGRISRPRR